MRKLLAGVVILLAACSDDPSGPDVPHIGGTYTFSFNVANSAAGFSCNGNGTMTLNQQVERFSGTTTGAAECTTPSGRVNTSAAAPVTQGELEGDEVEFRFQLFDATCDAAGTTAGNPVDTMQGDVTCVLTRSGQQITLTGPWQASRS